MVQHKYINQSKIRSFPQCIKMEDEQLIHLLPSVVNENETVATTESE